MKQTKTLFGFITIIALAALLPACGSTSPSDSGSGSLVIEDTAVGFGAAVVSGDTITVNYTGTLTNGSVFDSSLNAGRTPFTTRIGVGAVIKGWDQGLIGMRVGGRRKLTVPPSLGYGSQAQQGIPANSTLIFDITLISIVGK